MWQVLVFLLLTTHKYMQAGDLPDRALYSKLYSSLFGYVARDLNFFITK